MSERIQTPITGITTTSDYTEGDTYSLVNLRPQYGALHPVSPRKEVQELSKKYDVVFVHQNNDYKNWLGVINGDDYSSVYWDVRDEQPDSIASYILGKINSVQQIGNTISLITENNIYYLFYQNGTYRFLGELPEIPVITFGSSESDELYSQTLKYNEEYGSDAKITKDNFFEYTQGLVNKITDTKDYLFDAVLVRYAFRLYDGTLVKHSPPILVSYTTNTLSTKMINYRINGTNFYNESAVTVTGYKMKMNYDLTNITAWDDIIQSVDLFMSAPIGLTTLTKDFVDSLYRDTEGKYTNTYLTEINSKNFEKIETQGNFYLIEELSIGTSTSNYTYPNSITPYKGSAYLIQQERMTDDSFSHHRYGAKCSYVYNGRLHLANVNTAFFKGFHSAYFDWISDRYNGYKVTNNSTIRYKELLIEVEINTGNKIDKLYSTHKYSDVVSLFWTPFISYPDPRAKSMVIYGVLEDNTVLQIQTFNLKAHISLNLAYYLNISFPSMDFNDFVFPIIEKDDNIVDRPDTNLAFSLSEPNKVKVSELNNPLIFPNANAYQTGNGSILAMATNAMLVSDRNYGQYPLYVFTTQGIWTLNVGSGEVVYSTQSAPTSQKTPVSSFVCETPQGVVFITTQGLNLINNNQDVFISSQIEETPLRLHIETSPHCDNVVFSPQYKSFKELIPSIKSLVYNPKEDEIIINTASELNYVLSLEGSIFYQSTQRIDQIVNNTFPELYVINTNKLIDYSLSENTVTHVSLILRPLKYGTPDIKRLERMILRGIFYNIKNPASDKFSLVMIHASNDNVNFRCMRALSIKEGNHKDNDMGLLAATKYRHLLVTFAGMMDDNSQIQYLESMVDKQYDNTKMR